MKSITKFITYKRLFYLLLIALIAVLLFPRRNKDIPLVLQQRADDFEILHPECKIVFKRENPGGKLNLLCNVYKKTFSNDRDEANSALYYMGIFEKEVGQEYANSLDLSVNFPDHNKQKLTTGN